MIVTCFSAREVRTNVGFPYHNQNIKSPMESLKMLQRVLAREKEKDVIVVNNRTGFEEGDRFLDSLPFRVEHRDNNGGSFAAYNHAFQKYRAEFDYWLFSEDDILITRRAARFIERFEKEPNCGFLAIVGCNDRPGREHAHGGVGLTRRDVLDVICAKNGGSLPRTKKQGWIKEDIELNGEVALGQAIIGAGFRIIPYGDNVRWSVRNGCLPYYDYMQSVQ